MTRRAGLRKLDIFVTNVELHMSDDKPADKNRQMTPEEAAEFAEQVFNKAREGDAAMLAAFAEQGFAAQFAQSQGRHPVDAGQLSRAR